MGALLIFLVTFATPFLAVTKGLRIVLINSCQSDMSFSSLLSTDDLMQNTQLDSFRSVFACETTVVHYYNATRAIELIRKTRPPNFGWHTLYSQTAVGNYFMKHKGLITHSMCALSTLMFLRELKYIIGQAFTRLWRGDLMRTMYPAFLINLPYFTAGCVWDRRIIAVILFGGFIGYLLSIRGL